MEQQGEIVLYQPETTFKLEVRLENETVWLTQAQIAELFGTGRQAITKHLKNIFNSNDLEENSVCSILELTAADGKTYKTKIYNLDAILSVGYRVNSKNATSFRCWANKILKEYLLRGYSINKRLNNIEQRINNDLPKHEQRIGQIEEKLDLQRHNAEYPAIAIHEYKQSHDRFLIIDSEVFHIGASLKDLEKKWFAFSKLHFSPQELIERMLTEIQK